MIDPAALAFDIDGVIADTMQLFLDILDVHYDVHHIKYEDITCYRLDQCLDLNAETIEAAAIRILDGNYRATLQPYSEAGAVLKRILAATGRVLMVTARPDSGLIADWMRRLLDGQHHRAQIVATGSHEAKTEVLLANGVRWFVEDRLETCDLLKAAGIEPVVFRQPWNREPRDYLEVASWLELERHIDYP